MEGKKYKLSAGANEDLVAKMGFCLASDKITVDGLPVGYMYREEPEEEDDSGSGRGALAAEGLGAREIFLAHEGAPREFRNL